MKTATITDLRYSKEHDNLVATFSSEDLDREYEDLDFTSHELNFKPEALGNRIVHYDPVEDEMMAVEALVRETVFRLSADLEPDNPKNLQSLHGGTDERIEIKWASGSKKSAQAVLKKHNKRIEEARESFST